MNLNAAELSALESGAVQIGVFFRLDTDNVTRLWLGMGKCDGGINVVDTRGELYYGAGELVDVPAFQQLINGAAEVITFGLSGVTPEIVALAARSAQRVRGRRCLIGVVIQDSDWQPLGAIHWGSLSYADFISLTQQPQDNPQQPILRGASLTVSSAFSARRRARFSYFTKQDQRLRSPSDGFCDRSSTYSRLVNKTWPRF